MIYEKTQEEYMSDFTFLTEEQCYGNDKLDILKKRGATATKVDPMSRTF